MGTEGDASAPPNWAVRALIGRNPRVTLVRMAIWVLALVVMARFVLIPIRVVGISMMPTYAENRVNFVNCLVYHFHPP